MEEEFLKFIPLDKSWIIRMGILDLINKYNDINKFLANQKNLGDDLIALKRVAEDWNSEKPLNVGESGTLYRFVRFILWKSRSSREIIKEGTLKTREICNNPEIIDWPISKLLTLDNHTSQWASASVLMGNTEKPDLLPFKLKLTYEAIEHWTERRKNNQCWLPIYDITIENQARAFIELLKTGKMDFQAKQPEDYCFARIFEIISPQEGECTFPSLKSHESNRIQEVEKAIQQSDNNQMVSSKDHRVVQAIVMRQIAQNKPVKIENPDCVTKSWPQFWDFIDYCKKLK